jgi:hypothetical protein
VVRRVAAGDALAVAETAATQVVIMNSEPSAIDHEAQHLLRGAVATVLPRC